MRNLIYFASNIDNNVPCLDMGRLIAECYDTHKPVLNRWVDRLPFAHRRAIYDAANLPGEIIGIPDFQRYVSIMDLADIMRYQFVEEVGKYLDNSVFCIFVYKHGNIYELRGWNTTNLLLGCYSRGFAFETSRDMLFSETCGHLEEKEFETWLETFFTFS
jgi:hypothetical protein